MRPRRPAPRGRRPPEERPRSSAAEGCDVMSVTIEKGQNCVLGVDVGNAAGDESGAVILNVKGYGLMSEWNRRNPTKQLCAGNIIVEVNGTRGYWGILRELSGSGRHELLVRLSMPVEGWPGWREQISQFGEAILHQDSLAALRFRKPQGASIFSSVETAVDSFTLLPGVRAGDVGVMYCCICMEAVGPDTSLAQLPCQHSFHSICAAQWLTQSVRHACPLCAAPALSSSSPSGASDSG